MLTAFSQGALRVWAVSGLAHTFGARAMADQAEEPSLHGKWAAKPSSRKSKLTLNGRDRSLVIYQLLLGTAEFKSLMLMAR